MKFNININQKIISERCPGLDIKDAAIIDYVVYQIGTGFPKKKELNGKTYYWFKYSKVLEDMPLLKVKTDDAIYRRFKKICDAQILEPHPHNKPTGETYFAKTQNFYTLFFGSNEEVKALKSRSVKKPNENISIGQKTEPKNSFGILTERRSVKKPNVDRSKNRTYNNIEDNNIEDNINDDDFAGKSENLKNKKPIIVGGELQYLSDAEINDQKSCAKKGNTAVVDLETWKKNILSNVTFKNACLRKYKHLNFDAEKLPEYFESFEATKMMEEKTTWRDYEDFKQNFFYWLNYHLTDGSKTKNGNARNSAFGKPRKNKSLTERLKEV